jgi:hypothetical protein
MSALVPRLFRIPLPWSPATWLTSCNGFPTASSNWLARIIMEREMISTACSCKGENRLKAMGYVSSKSILRICLDIPGSLSKNSLGHHMALWRAIQSIQAEIVISQLVQSFVFHAPSPDTVRRNSAGGKYFRLAGLLSKNQRKSDWLETVIACYQWIGSTRHRIQPILANRPHCAVRWPKFALLLFTIKLNLDLPFPPPIQQCPPR